MIKRAYAKMPTVFQMEATECGAAALSMILGYYGKHVPLEQMRIECGVSRNGSNARNILVAARKFGLEAHGYRKEVSGLLELSVPSILHWGFNHFVVFEGVKGKYYYINDPAEGRKKLTIDELSDGFTGVVLTFLKTPEFVPSGKTKSLLSFAIERLKGQLQPILGLVVMGLLLVFPGLAIPAFSQVFIDGILVEGNYSWIYGLITAMLSTLIFRLLLSYYRGILMLKLQNKLSLISAHGFISHLLRLPINFFSQRYVGDLSSRVENNNNVSEFLTSEVAETILNLMVAFFYLILLLVYSPVLTAAGLVIMLFNMFLTKKFSNAIEDIAVRKQQDEGKLLGRVFAGIKVSNALKASGTEGEYAGRLQGYYANCILTEQKLGKRQEILNVIPDVGEQFSSLVILILGGILIIRGAMTEGMLVAFCSLFGEFIEPVNELAGFVTTIQTAKADMRRVEDVMKYEEDSKFKNSIKENMKTKLEGNIELSGISFGYSILEPPFIKDFCFSISCGTSIAFVGKSGSGKSTISKICGGLFRQWSGDYSIDGVRVEDIPAEVLSGSISAVSQEIALFAGTVRDNLTMWNKDIPETDIIKAAKDACIHDVITARPGAYDSRVLENGANFSGGQKQRLEIARALAINPSILIMDEATSALDPITEKKIMDNIKRRGCTCIVVAHRLSAIRDCDEIIVMEHGEIVQRGRHKELADTEGYYKHLIQNEA